MWVEIQSDVRNPFWKLTQAGAGPAAEVYHAFAGTGLNEALDESPVAGGGPH
jgi:hypothetical protein